MSEMESNVNCSQVGLKKYSNEKHLHLQYHSPVFAVIIKSLKTEGCPLSAAVNLVGLGLKVDMKINLTQFQQQSDGETKKSMSSFLGSMNSLKL